MPIQATYINASGTDFFRSWIGGQNQALTEWVVKSPGYHLNPQHIEQTFEIDEHLKDVATGDSWIFCSWECSVPQYWFGIQIVFPFQMFHLGFRPYYQIASQTYAPHSIEAINWRTPVKDPSEPYTFTHEADSLPAGLQIECSPISGGQSMILTTLINKPRPSKGQGNGAVTVSKKSNR